MKFAFINNDKKLGTGASFINDLMAQCLRESGARVKNFYPKTPLFDAPLHLKGLENILFFYSLLEHKVDILKYDLIQGTTYTPIAFLPFSIPVVSHFGSTSWGFLKAVPMAKDLEPHLRDIWTSLKQQSVIRELNLRTRRPIKDIAAIEKLVAKRANAVIATSCIVRQDLLDAGIAADHIHLVWNAIEDYWFTKQKPFLITTAPALLFLGRLGSDAFTLKLKGLDRLIDFYQQFPKLEKETIGMTTNKKVIDWLNASLPKHTFHQNLIKDQIPEFLQTKFGSILLITSRYEGFSLSLIEGMSQGLIPVTYAVGVAPEIIINGKNGFLITSQEQGMQAIRDILKLSIEQRTAMALAAQQTAKQFHSKAIAQALLKVYTKTIHQAQ